jgi:hypothetical protein
MGLTSSHCQVSAVTTPLERGGHGVKTIVIIIIIIIIIISFVHGIYTYIPQTNYVPREYSVAAIL